MTDALIFQNSFGNSNKKSNGFALKRVADTDLPVCGKESFPLLKLPGDFSGYDWKGVYEEVSDVKYFSTDIDKILTEYSHCRLKTLFTLEFLEYVDRQYTQFSFPKENNKLSFAVNLYLTITDYLALIYGDEALKILSFYFGGGLIPQKNPFAIPNPFAGSNPFGDAKNYFNIGRANLYLTLFEETYVNRLTRIFVFSSESKKTQSIQISEQRARELTDTVNRRMKADVDVYFVNARARALQVLPDDVKSDERFIHSLHDARWNEYDETIKKEVAFYNQKFSGKGTNFIPLDWRWVKAMLWTEVYGPNIKSGFWQRLPMQIGRFAQDFGYEAVSKAGQDEGADLVVEDELKQKVQVKGNVTGHLNVRAGVAYLFIRATNGVIAEDTPSKPETVFSHTIEKGETGLSKIADNLGTTVENLEKIKPGISSTTLHIGQVINYQKSKMVRKIAAWRNWQEAIRRYNKGDAEYIPKVNRAYKIITSRMSE